MKRSLGINTHHKLSYHLFLVRDKRRIFIQHSDRMITDVGLDNIASTPRADLFKAMLLDDTINPTPVRRDSSTITVTQTGTAMVASGGFFEPSDTGRLFKYNDGPGTEVYMTYIDSTHAVASVSASVAPINGTVWYVNRTSLQNVALSGTTYGSSGGDNGTTYSGATMVMQRSIISGAAGAPLTLTAIGFNSSTANSNVFDLDIITGGLSILAGDRVEAVIQLSVTFSPITPATQSNVGTGYDTSGSFQIEGLNAGNHGVSTVDSSGNTTNTRLDPGGDVSDLNTGLIIGAFSFGTFSFTSAVGRSLSQAGVTGGGYTAGSFSRDYTSFFDVADGNGTFNGLTLNPTGTACCITVNLTTPFTKTSSQTLTVVWTQSWSRTLVN